MVPLTIGAEPGWEEGTIQRGCEDRGGKVEAPWETTNPKPFGVLLELRRDEDGEPTGWEAGGY